MNWRMIYNNTDVIDLFETSDITITPYNIFEAKTQEECFDKIDQLSLFYYHPLNKNEILLFSGGTRTTMHITNS